MISNGVFAEWQPRYADAGIPTFPVANKKPGIRHYQRTGLIGSRKLVDKFGNAPALGFLCKRADLTILDIDTPDERVLADALSEYGNTPVIVQSGSGNYQAWFRNNGEGRKIRPDKSRPIDILGDGYVVAPPSQGSKGAYQFIAGSLADLASLPVMRAPVVPICTVAPLHAPAPDLVDVGKRNETLFRDCMAAAKSCACLDDLVAYARSTNAEKFAAPLPNSEVVTTASSAWKIECSGNNRFGGEMIVGAPGSHFDRIGPADAFALALYVTLRRHWRDGETFVVANEMHKAYGWPRRKFIEARSSLERHRLLVMVRPPIKGVGPAVYRFGAK